MSELDRAALVTVFAGFPRRLVEALSAAPGPLVAPRTAVMPGEWGAAEVVRHLIAVEREIWQSRLAQIALEDGARWTWVEPGPEPGFDGAPLDEIVVAFGVARAETVATILDLDDAGWARYGTHATFGMLDVAGLLGIAVNHDAEHLRGIAGEG